MTPPATIETALRNHAEGSCCLAAAAELLIAQTWLHRADFTSQFITLHRSPGSGKPMAVIDWPAAVTALGTSLPCSGGEQRMLKSPQAWPTASPSTSAIPSPASTTATSSS